MRDSDNRGRQSSIDASSNKLSVKRKAPFAYGFGRMLGYLCFLGIFIVAVLAILLLNVFQAIIVGTIINSLLTMACYKTDKFFAQQQIWRIPEKSLHCWELFWGWPGALFAQRKFRHKNAKISFQCIFWLCVILNCIGSYFLIRYFPNEILRQLHR